MNKKEKKTVLVVVHLLCRCASASNTGTIAAAGTTPHTATLVHPICAELFHRHYSGQPALLSRYYRGTTTGSSWYVLGIYGNTNLSIIPLTYLFSALWCVNFHEKTF